MSEHAFVSESATSTHTVRDLRRTFNSGTQLQKQRSNSSGRTRISIGIKENLQ